MSIFEFWKEVESGEKHIHPDDKTVLAELKHYHKSDLNYSFPPGPFFGPLKTAKIILCYANPSVDAPSLDTVACNLNRETLMRQLDGEQPYPYELNGWGQWFSQRANSLFGGDVKLASKQLAVINLIPYASKSMDNVERIASCLPSAWAAQNYLRYTLIPKALKGEILLVMCRSAHLWGLRSSHGSDHIIINTARSGFDQNSKKRITEWHT
ncbi:hypothetical protein M0C34_11825 [Agarivorans sp. TSD2052]|uniref:hypothetical protein n=1 Tax=Agarivorans sp. TSD2052 TaxID=2937286 RepID=UPI00200D8F5D|nr:hypothetical protein [Agarivorans sp. TSD2052]UPW16934.1 hypothetical protein M0C34_11825 [Agarivorans sp. TSD2052]